MSNRNLLKLILLTFLCAAALTLTGCGSQALVESSSYKTEYLPEEDYNYLSYSWWDESQRMAQSDKGIYFLAGYYLFFMDWDTRQTVPLCFKPDCLHADETDQEKVVFCDAFIGGGAVQTPFLAYYRDKIYTICIDRTTGEDNLVEMNPDGSDRKILCSVSNSETLLLSQIFMHRGVIYFFSNLKDLNGEAHYGLNALSVVSDSHEPVQVYTGSFEGGWVQDFFAFENYIFFADCYETDTSFDRKTIMYDIRTGESEGILGEGNAIYGLEDNNLLIRQDGLYYVYSLKDKTLTPSGRNYDTFLQAHPQWQCHCENPDEDFAMFSYYDLETDNIIYDSYVINSQGEVAAIIPDVAWSNGCIYDMDGEKYVFRYVYNNSAIRAYAKKDLLQGIINPIIVFDADNYNDLIPAYLTKTSN